MYYLYLIYMHLLFISSNRIGDSLINLQVLNKYIRKNKKDIQITLVSGSLPLPIYDDYPNIIRRIILKKKNIICIGGNCIRSLTLLDLMKFLILDHP